jgi:hypothetical protein
MDGRSERVAKRFERSLIVAAVLTIPVTILQLLPPPDPWRTMADVLNWLIWFAFLAEVVVMLAVVPSKPAWLRRLDDGCEDWAGEKHDRDLDRMTAGHWCRRRSIRASAPARDRQHRGRRARGDPGDLSPTTTP